MRQVTLGCNPYNASRGVAVPCFDNPIVLATRPQLSSEQFLAALKECAGPFQRLISPAFEYCGTGAVVPAFEIGIFTSRAGVSFAPKGDGRIAYCVGNSTAEAAEDAGYRPISANGTASELTELILEHEPKKHMLHLRGETSVGNVKEKLEISGLSCQEAVLYRKKLCSPKTEAIEALTSRDAILLPLFSAETVSIIADWGVDLGVAHVTAISPVVAGAAEALSPASIIISKAPNQLEMVAATSRLIA
ncbi:uroporphyrinogen-III synthase [Octadecabacter sp. CECT 8868]|uniref:uroporphyrinogen-III synthase n=1 Tax=Octadecabacter algicola TaxID=2909342 RepID=UPI001F34EDFE|nr:uroporphyrinogen-III synthase [Octadecabacter algicola]MCF2905998.1 uroporphyrinogen-III synthase [Octadecabacter algicola]